MEMIETYVELKPSPKALRAAARIWQMACAQTLIDARQEGRTPSVDAMTGKIQPTQKALDQAKREHPRLYCVSVEVISARPKRRVPALCS